MWIKICGNTNLEDARFAAECGAQALGFVFAPSPRRVEADLVQRITEHLPPQLEKYGVFADAGFDEIVSTVNASGLTGVQLHRTADPLLPFRLREHFAGRIGIMRVLHFIGQDFEQQMKELSRSEDAVLVDSSTSRAIGGTGTSFDWHKASSTFLRAAPNLRVVAAGGLAPENVKQAIQTMQPWGVDVVSGVESAPGKKDPARVLAFIRSAQEASAELQDTVAAAKTTNGKEGRS
jgi:phosphoribosylanthranilate isomerase